MHGQLQEFATELLIPLHTAGYFPLRRHHLVPVKADCLVASYSAPPRCTSSAFFFLQQEVQTDEWMYQINADDRDDPWALWTKVWDNLGDQKTVLRMSHCAMRASGMCPTQVTHRERALPCHTGKQEARGRVEPGNGHGMGGWRPNDTVVGSGVQMIPWWGVASK